METKTKTTPVEKDFDAVKSIRAIKEKMSKDMWGMTLEQIKEYLRTQPSSPAVQRP